MQRPDIYDTLQTHDNELAELRAELQSVKAGRVTKVWYTRTEAAEYLCISGTKLHDLRASGRLIGHQIDGKPVFHINDLDAVAERDAPIRLAS